MTVELKPLPFEEAIKFFADKIVLPPALYKKLTDEAKAKAFSTTGVARMNILNDLFSSIDKSLTEGSSYGGWKKTIKDIMQKRGWDGLAPYRLENIFRTNIQTAYQAGHYARQMEVVHDKPFWQYSAVMDSRTRPLHAAMHGKVLPYDHPWWKKNYPPNGFSCRCTVVALSKEEMRRDGLKKEEETPFDIFDKGWGHNPGQWEVYDKNALSDDSIVKTLQGQKQYSDYGRVNVRDITDKSPAPGLIPAAKSRAEAVKIVSAALGVKKERVRIVTTPIEEVVIDRDRLSHIVRKAEEKRERYANYIIPTLEDPYEVYMTRYEDGWRRRYIKLWTGKYNIMAVVRINRDGSILWNVIEADDKRMNKLREGLLLYGK